MKNSAVVVCTRNRPRDLSKCLDSIFEQSSVPSLVLIVDSSDNNETEILSKNESFRGVTYVHADRGLTLQRNVALRFLRNSQISIVHFLDDDVILDPNYFLEMEKGLGSSSKIVGVAATIRKISRARAKPLEKFALWNSDKPGTVLRSGVNIGSYSHPEVVEVDWLPGCCMSFRLDKITGLEFDESRSGYAMGEDVDFSLKAKARGALLHLPAATLLHNLSDTNRHDAITLQTLDIKNRWKLAIDHPRYVQKFWVAYSTIFSSCYFLVIGARNLNKEYLNRAVATFKTIWGCIIGAV